MKRRNAPFLLPKHLGAPGLENWMQGAFLLFIILICIGVIGLGISVSILIEQHAHDEKLFIFNGTLGLVSGIYGGILMNYLLIQLQERKKDSDTLQKLITTVRADRAPIYIPIKNGRNPHTADGQFSAQCDYRVRLQKYIFEVEILIMSTTLFLILLVISLSLIQVDQLGASFCVLSVCTFLVIHGFMRFALLGIYSIARDAHLLQVDNHDYQSLYHNGMGPLVEFQKNIVGASFLFPYCTGSIATITLLIFSLVYLSDNGS